MGRIRRGTFRYALKTLLAAVLGLSLLCMMAGMAFAASAHSVIPAHAKVSSANPSINSTVNQVPATVTVFTEENINPDPAKSNLIVYGPSADATDTVISKGNAQVSLANPRQMSINITPNSGHVNGVYVVYWKTVSADDGDPADGTFSFTVNTNGTSARSTPASGQNNATVSTGAPIWVPIVAALVALLIGLGAGLGLGRRKPAPATSPFGAMRSAVAEELKKE